jgi:hypothetical protein
MAHQTGLFSNVRRTMARSIRSLKRLPAKIAGGIRALWKHPGRLPGMLWNGIRYVWERPVIVTAVLLIVAAVILNLVIAQTFGSFFTCRSLIGGIGMGFLCETNDFLFIHIPDSTSPAGMDPKLELLRLGLTWIIVAVFAFVSVILTFIARKFIAFAETLATEAGRKRALTTLSIWLLFFAIFCSLFYFNVVK